MNREKKYVIAYNKKHFQVSHNCENRLQWLSTQIIPCLQYFLYATNTQSGVRTLLESRVIGLCELSTRIYWLNVKTKKEMETWVDSLKALHCTVTLTPRRPLGQPGVSLASDGGHHWLEWEVSWLWQPSADWAPGWWQWLGRLVTRLLSPRQPGLLGGWELSPASGQIPVTSK